MPTVRFFAAAAEVIGSLELSIPATTVGDLRAHIAQSYGQSANKVILRCSLLVNGVRTDADDAPLTDADLVDVLPPFAGG